MGIKGDIQILTAFDGAVLLSVNAVDGSVLVVDALAPAGIKWAAGPVFSVFTQDLGAARMSGTFDITGLSGLIADKSIMVMQTAAPISSKGNARDESEMDLIRLTGYVVDATTIRIYWQAPTVVVGTYAFAYLISG